MANQYVDELRTLTANLAVSEAQRRRVFFEGQMVAAKNNLIKAQTALQGSGISLGAIKAEPQAAADGYARLRAELTAAQVTLDTTRGSMTENTPEVQQLVNRVQALRDQLHTLEQSEVSTDKSADYVSKYREFKYQEALFDMMARQYELARVDEAREGAMVQVVDPARAPEHKTWPKRSIAALIGGFACLFGYAGWLLARERIRMALRDPKTAEEWASFRKILSRA
jgi:capsule polysaccharide export protein KpsE/RkpR